MRLINTRTRTLKLQEFLGEKPPYAILSHVWGSEEVSLQDFSDPRIREKKAGFVKIQEACRRANSQGYDYLWVDTCCIDKTSSADLGEAINSMFKWYQEAAVCYAFLEDIPKIGSSLHRRTGITSDIDFGHSRWFTRGWTLQELIAPANVEFYNEAWEFIGEKRELSK